MRRGERVALVLEEYDQFFVGMIGAWLAGAVVVPLNVSLPQRDVDWLLAKAQPRALLVPDDDACPGDGPDATGRGVRRRRRWWPAACGPAGGASPSATAGATGGRRSSRCGPTSWR